MIKLHLFSGFENPVLGIKADTELGHLYDDGNNQLEVTKAAIRVGCGRNWLQRTTLVHYDLWGRPLEKAKLIYPIATDLELYEDMAHMADTRVE